MADFRMECHHNEYLPAGVSTLHAVITVTAENTAVGGPGVDGRPENRAEVIIVDTSGSMRGPKINEAKAATAAAIDCLPDGVRFAVVAGTGRARVVYPASPPLAVSTPRTRPLAKDALRGLEAEGGTAMSQWITLATTLLRDEPGLRHAILLTDGKNESEAPEVLDQSLAEAVGVFQCDCRGVGGDWEVAELRKIATALLGSYDLVRDPAALTADFEAMMAAALSKQVAAVALQVRTIQGGRVELMKQLGDPDIDLTGSRIEVDPLVGEYPTGAWGDESRDYHLVIDVPPGAVGDEMMRAAQVTLVVDGEKTAQLPVLATWTTDLELSTKMNPKVAEVRGQADIAAWFDEGLLALKRGDEEVATDRLRRVRQAAADLGNDDVHDAVDKFFDPVSDRVRPREDIDNEDLIEGELATGRTHLTGARPNPAGDPGPVADPGAPSDPLDEGDDE